MDDKQIPNDKIATEEILSDKELDSVTGGFGLGFALLLYHSIKSLNGGNNPSKKDEPNPFKDHSGGQTGHG